MCKISDEIKFCTCAEVEHPDGLDNYWVFHRFDKNKDELVVGMILRPMDIDPVLYETNQTLLTERLNQPDAFDTDMKPRAKDRLLLCFKQGNASMEYGFEYRARSWKPISYHPLEWEWHHNAIKTGCIC